MQCKHVYRAWSLSLAHVRSLTAVYSQFFLRAGRAAAGSRGRGSCVHVGDKGATRPCGTRPFEALPPPARAPAQADLWLTAGSQLLPDLPPAALAPPQTCRPKRLRSRNGAALRALPGTRSARAVYQLTKAESPEASGGRHPYCRCAHGRGFICRPRPGADAGASCSPLAAASQAPSPLQPLP